MSGVKGSKLNRTNLMIFGATAILLGMMAMLAPTVTGYSIIFLVGILVAGAGLVRMVWAFRTPTLGKGLILFGLGGLTFVAGLAMVTHPVFASGVLTTILTIYFIFDGAMEIAAGALIRPIKGWIWLLLGGVVSVLLGVLLWLQFPFSGVWAVGILLGIKLLFIGVIMMTTGSQMKTGL